MAGAPSYDVVVAGGSIAGLLCAREIASAGHSVLVVEEDYEIGTPEHCGGLVSSAGLGQLGIVPFGDTLMHRIEKARITSPDGAHSVTIDARRQGVLGISRRELDKQVAHQAQRAGAVITTRTSLQEVTETGVRVTTGGGAGRDGGSLIDCRTVVDARGVSSLVQKNRTGVIPSAQYEVYADWIEDGTVEVLPDRQRYPGFFAWVIPSGRGRGRVGVAGRGINVAEALEAFLAERGGSSGSGSSGGRHSTIRRIFAPIWINGPIKRFYDGNVITVGDAAGQAKPTTAGGIFSSGMGGMLAGQIISQYLDGSIPDMDAAGRSYQREWRGRFGREFGRQLLARRILERADNASITDMIKSVPPGALQEISSGHDFDFHVSAIVRLLGVSGAARTAQGMIGSELRRVLLHRPNGKGRQHQ